MNKEAIKEINSMDKHVAFTAAEELLNDMKIKFETKFPVLSRAASNVEEIEVMDFTVEYAGPDKGYVLTNWVFGVRAKFGQWITGDCLYIIEELVRDRVQKEINRTMKEIMD